MTATEQPTVRAGQVWQDCDPRMNNRTLRIDEVDSRYAYCTTVNPATHRTWGVSRKTRILLSRFRPISTGYRLVSDAPEEAKADA